VQLRFGNEPALAAAVTETLPQALKRDPGTGGSYARLKGVLHPSLDTRILERLYKAHMVTDKDVSYVADLAHLELTEDERVRMLKDLNSILGYIDRLNELDTSNVEPMAQVASRQPRRGGETSGTEGYAYAMRADEPRPSLPHEEAMRNAPVSDGVFFKVPKVIER
jgi:aspartyl-tRNA(Asn)/glutamyl-tRNA(Gln) amidotransferase subunit C